MIYNTKYIFLIILLLISAYFDLRYRKIPNYLILTGVISAVLVNTFLNGFSGLVGSVIGFSLGILLLIIPFALGGIGAGDVKLLGVVGAVNGTTLVFHTFICMAIWGGLISIVMLLCNRQMLKILKWIVVLIKELVLTAASLGRRMITINPLPTTGLSLPYAVPLFMGTATVFLIGGYLC